MMSAKSEEFKYTPESNNGAVIGILEGPCADIVDATRNGRFYSEELWEKVFDSDLVKEMLANGGIFGESQHPVDRTEVDTEKIAIAMKERPVKKNGKLIGKFYILNTPCGKILKTLADFGYKIGISSRGNGDVYSDENGNESVDPDTYEFSCFDAVITPAVKAARMNYTPVTESLQKKKSLTESLNTLVSEASEADKKVMVEALNTLNIDYNLSNDTENIEDNIEAEDNGSILTEEFQKQVQENSQLKEQIKELQEKVSAGYSRETSLNEELTRYKTALATVSDSVRSAKAYKAQTEKLEEGIKTLKENYSSEIAKVNKIILAQNQALSESKEQNKQLNEKIAQMNKENSELNKTLTEQLASKEQELNQLKESFSDMQTEYSIKKREFNKKLTKLSNLAESYKKQSDELLNRYVSSKAVQCGVSSDEVKNRLNEGYTLKDVDSVCEQLQQYKFNMNSLPFSLNESIPKNIKGGSVKRTKPSNDPFNDDSIDETLLGLLDI